MSDQKLFSLRLLYPPGQALDRYTGEAGAYVNNASHFFTAGRPEDTDSGSWRDGTAAQALKIVIRYLDTGTETIQIGFSTDGLTETLETVVTKANSGLWKNAVLTLAATPIFAGTYYSDNAIIPNGLDADFRLTSSGALYLGCVILQDTATKATVVWMASLDSLVATLASATAFALAGFTPTRVLFIGPGGVIAEDAGFTYASGTDTVTIAGGLNLGSASGAPLGNLYAKSAGATEVRLDSSDADQNPVYSLYTNGVLRGRFYYAGANAGGSEFVYLQSDTNSDGIVVLVTGNKQFLLFTNGTQRIGVSGAGVTQIGAPGGGADYAQFAADGEINLAGTARVRKEIQLAVAAIGKGVASPGDVNRLLGASGAVYARVYQFSKTVQNDAYFAIHMPHDVDDSVNVTFHIMWLPGSGWTAGNYLWKLEYLVKNDTGSAYNAGAPTTIQMDVTPANATTMLETEFTDAIDANTDQIIYAHLYRDVAGDNGDDTGDLLFAEIEYTSNKLGEAT